MANAQPNLPAQQPEDQQIVPFEAAPEEYPLEQPSLERLKEWLLRTDHALGRRLDDLRRWYGIDPLFTVFMSVLLLTAWMILHPKWAPVASQFICCCTYPLFESIAALRDRDHDGLRVWCVYWYVYDLLGTFDLFAHMTLLYYPAKTALAAYLFLPPTQYISIIYDAWLMPMIELIYGELHVETLRWAHPMVLRMMGLTREKIRDWSQEQLQIYLSQCRRMFYLFLIQLHQLLAEAMRNPEPEPPVVEVPVD